MNSTLSDLQVHELSRTRFSPKHFHPEPVPQEALRAVFEAARWSPSCFNDQPWSFVYARRGTDAFDRFVATMAPKNAEWAKEAPVLILAVTRAAFAHNGKPNRHAQYDTGQAVAWLSVEATARGLFVHQMAGFDAAAAAEAVGLPEGWQAMTLMALGYSPDQPSGTRSRKALSSTVFEGRFDGTPL